MPVDEQRNLERAVSGALRAAIKDHGPITPERIGSATKRVIGNLRNARLLPAEAAAALGRRGGLAGKEAGRNYSRLGARGGRAGKGSPKPRSPEALRRILARRLIRASEASTGYFVIDVEHIVKIAPDRPDIHRRIALEDAAIALGVEREVAALSKES